ncbi:DUF4386 domain-containing protein [Compostimonas suwonensis]|uniref:Uncharacterized protein DUF4386 n=1 Tax=Compostimonas suwonensis TaxID=1048394 RepID=A0A2M9C3G7_9MICO|nr:DUF4386 domain-containing protein [Compostimonas suwonensis]PJJ65081.1 uncharacterized protein DUF4386 [Compostimonas suwonensis]
MPHPQRAARIAGGLYLLTVVTSIPALALKAPVLSDPASAAGGSAALTWAALLEVVLAAACVGTAVVLYPVVRRQGETAALGFVVARTLESGLVLSGVIAMLALARVTGAAAPGLVAIHDGAFLIGPGLIPAANALCLGYLLYRSRLVPRVIPLVGLVGAPLLIASAIASLFGVTGQVSAVAGVAALPIALWEISLGLWLVVKGFRAEPLATLMAGRVAA